MQGHRGAASVDDVLLSIDDSRATLGAGGRASAKSDKGRDDQRSHSDRARFAKYFHGMLDEGVYLAPSQFEAGFLSAAHTALDIEHTVRAAAKAMQRIR